MASGERDQQGGLQADVSFVPGSAMSGFAGSAGAVAPIWAQGWGDEGWLCAHVSRCRCWVVGQGGKL